MSYPVTRPFTRFASLWLALAAVSVLPLAARAQLEKMADFRVVNNVNTGAYESGSSNPYDNSVQIGDRLWFTTQNGGAFGFGSISYYDLNTKTITAFASMTSATGNTPLSSVTAVGNTLYFTTTRGGTGDTGTVSSVDITATNPTITPLVNLGPTTTTTNPRTPSGGLTSIDRGAAGVDLYYTTSNGGAGGAAFGTISRYNTLTGTNTVVHNFTGSGTSSGRQPMEGFTNIGGKLYFTTFTGGTNAGTGFPNGTGTINVFDPATNAVTTLGSLPSGGAQFPAHNVTQAGNGLLYFTTTGNATQPGSLQSFNIQTGILSTVYSLTGAATASGPFPDGRFGYGSVVELNNVLYFTTIQGGTYNRGTVNAFNLNTNTFSKLYDLDGGIATGDGPLRLGQEARGGFTVVNENGVDYLYLLTRAGGLYSSGTVLRLTPLANVPEPGTVAMLLVAGAGSWWWRRRGSASARDAAVPARPQPARLGDRRRAFTLIELLVVLGIIVVLSGVAIPVASRVMDKARETACLNNLRQIGAAYHLYAGDHDGFFPTAEDIGYSSFRAADDPLGLPTLFIPYLGGENKADKQNKVQGNTKLWLCPGGRPSLKAYGNNYAWSRAGNITGKPANSIANASSTTLVWDNFTMTLPSVDNVPESASTGGPRVPSGSQYRFYAHRSRTKANYVFADGHASTL